MPGHAAKSTPMYDDNPSLKGGQSRLPDVVQKAIIKKKAKGLKEKVAAHGAEYDDSHMLCKSLERTAAQAMHLKEKIQAGLVLPSWAEYKIYKAYDSVNSALGASYPGHYPMGMGGHMMEKQPSPMIVKAAAHCMGKHRKKKKPLMKKASAEQEIMAALTAEGGAAGMGAIKKRVSSPELAAAMKRLMAQGKIHKHRDGDIIKK